MVFSQSFTGKRDGRPLVAGVLFSIAVATGSAAPASAQDLVHTFINPSFGGNPFNSDHLLAIANIDRPAAPVAPTDPPLTEQDLIAQQLQSRLLSALTSDLVSTILNATPGQSGEFVLGTQRISYTRTTTETRVTFLNTVTGETTELVIPVSGSNSASLSAQGVSAEQALSATSNSVNGALNAGSPTNSLSAAVTEIPLGAPPL